MARNLRCIPQVLLPRTTTNSGLWLTAAAATRSFLAVLNHNVVPDGDAREKTRRTRGSTAVGMSGWLMVYLNHVSPPPPHPLLTAPLETRSRVLSDHRSLSRTREKLRMYVHFKIDIKPPPRLHKNPTDCKGVCSKHRLAKSCRRGRYLEILVDPPFPRRAPGAKRKGSQRAPEEPSPVR